MTLYQHFRNACCAAKIAIDLEWWIFAVASMMALIIALMTVSVQAIKAAVQNPVNSLRSE